MPAQAEHFASAQASADEDEEDHARLLSPGSFLAARFADQVIEGSFDRADLGRREDAPASPWLARPVH